MKAQKLSELSNSHDYCEIFCLVLLACDQNLCTSMKYKALFRDYDIDISQTYVSCYCLPKLVYDKVQMVVHASLR